MFQTRSTQLLDWFAQEWGALRRLDKQLYQQYINEHKHEKGAHDERLGKLDLPRVTGLRFRSTGKTPRNRWSGVCTVSTPIGERNFEFRYSSHVEAVHKAIWYLTEEGRNSDTLAQIEKVGFKVGNQPLMSRTKSKVYKKASGERRGHMPRPLPRFNGWWISHDTGPTEKLELIGSIAKICGVTIETDEASEHGF